MAPPRPLPPGTCGGRTVAAGSVGGVALVALVGVPGCGSNRPDAQGEVPHVVSTPDRVEVGSAGVPLTSPPPEREPFSCCPDPRSETLLRAYLAMNRTLADGVPAAMRSRALELEAAATALAADAAAQTLPPDRVQRIATLAGRYEPANPDLTREYHAEVSSLLVVALEPLAESSAGAIPVALACDPERQWPWLQEGATLQNPYGGTVGRWGPCDPLPRSSPDLSKDAPEDG